jgi:frizzled protein 5/8
MERLVLLLLLTVLWLEGGASSSSKETCEEISIPMCKEIGYNSTRLPNQFNHRTQDEVS